MNAADRRQINQARNARDRALDAIHETRQALARAEQADDMVERIVLEAELESLIRAAKIAHENIVRAARASVTIP